MSLSTLSPAPPEANPARRRPSLLTFVLVALLLVIVAGGTVVMLSPLGDPIWALLGRPVNASARLLPAETVAYARLTPTGPQLRNLEALKARLLAVPELKDGWTRLERSMTRDGELSWEADIQPWLGPEIVVAMTSVQGLGDARTPDPAMVLAAATRDRTKSDAFIKKVGVIQERRNQRMVQKTYAGVTYLIDDGDTSLTTVGNYVVVASTEAALKQLIDLAAGKGGQALIDSPTYSEVVRALPADRLGDAYVNLLPIVTELGKAPNVQLSAKQREALASVRALGLALRVEPNGIAFDTVTLYDAAKMSADQQAMAKQVANPLQVAGAVPDQTIALLALRDLRPLWSAAVAQLSADRSFTSGLEAFQRASGLSVEDDIISLMTGEVGLALIEDRASFAGNAQLPAGGLLLIEVTDRAVAEAKIAKIRAALEKQGMRFTRQQAGSVEFQVMAAGQGTPALGYGFVGNFLVVGTSGNALAQLVEGSPVPLNRSAPYQGMTTALPRERTSQLYIDLGRLIPLMSRLGGGDAADMARRASGVLKPVKAVAIASEPMGGGNLQRARLVISIPE